MKTVETINNLLHEQMDGYRKLVELLQRERNSLIELDAASVEELAKEKDIVILRLRLLEEERIRLTETFCNGDISLRKLSEMTGDRMFLDIRSIMISLVQSIEEMNEFNRLLTERSLHYVRSGLQFFSRFGFGADGTSVGSLVSREM